ncbi:MAG: 16S rRNA (cytosine(967)-C(5))-methyltransferase, partial [Lachnospiraceae bacterium]|nr:16S rRNA (cytosine(967)-C(5))-methyltransferase [Lachnospiraceae bacterium]
MEISLSRGCWQELRGKVKLLDNKSINTRDIALSVLMDIETNNTFSNIALAKALKKNQFSNKQDRAFISRIVEGTVERLITLDYIINQFSKTKINKTKPLIRCLLRMGTYQIMYMDKVPDSAAVNEAVRLTKRHGFASLSGYVNAVLRNISRKKSDIKYPS